MNILVTGATGFIGRYLVQTLLDQGHAVTALARDPELAQGLPWFDRVRFVPHDVGQPLANPRSLLGLSDLVIHLAWSDLTDYRSLAHIERTLPAHYAFLKALVEAGAPRLLVTGTCFEYGLQSGALHEELDCRPTIPYAIAKDTLRRFLEALRQVHPFRLQWARLFYSYGEGQKSNSLLALLDRAIAAGEPVFNMSGGEQLRDFQPVEYLAAQLALVAQAEGFEGAINICSGTPISVRRLAEEHIARREACVRLNLGYYPYPAHEPMAYWGDAGKLETLARNQERAHAKT